MARTLIDICNEAMGEVPARDTIADIDASGLEERVCKRLVYNIVYDLIGLHDWEWARRRVALAEVTNDRTGEWAKAYALPANISSPIGLVPNYTTTATSGGLVVTPVYWPMSRIDLLEQSHDRINYRIANDILYTDLAEAYLEYSLETFEPTTWPSLFSHAVAMTLAHRALKPIRGASVKQEEVQELAAKADMAVREAIADDMNRNPREMRKFASETAIARGIGLGGYGRAVLGDFDLETGL